LPRSGRITAAVHEVRTPRLEWWTLLALLCALVEGALFVVPQTRPGGLLPVLCWYFGRSRLLWLTIAASVAIAGFCWSARRPPFLNRWRVTGYLVLSALAACPLGFQVYPSSHDRTPSSIAFRLPFDGPVTVGWGGATPSVNYHVIAPDQRWAYDLAITKDDNSFRGDGRRLDDYYTYGVPVYSPADGMVHAVSDGAPDLAIGAVYSGTNVCGNHVVLEVAPHQYLFLCHLKPGSIVVKNGDHLKAGQALGRAGNSGNSSEPHLHMHLQDGPKLHVAEAIPLYFHAYLVGNRLIERGIPTGGVAQQIVENARPRADAGNR